MCQELGAIHPGLDAAGDRQVLPVIRAGPRADRNEPGKEYSPDGRKGAASYAHVKKKSKQKLTSFPCNYRLM